MSTRHYGSHLRKGRYSESGRIYLLTTATHNRAPVFSNWTLGRLVVKEFRNAQDQQIANSIAWVVMPDHFHWLVELRSGDLGNLMRKVKTKSSLAIRNAEGYPFKLWQHGYHDQAVRKEGELVNIARYIIANPIRAGLVTRCGDYPLWDAVWV